MSEKRNAWQTARLGDVITANYGKALPQSKRKRGDVPVFGSNGAVGFHDQAITRGPTIVIGRKGSSGAINFSPYPCWPIDTTYYIDNPGPYSLEFLEQLLRSLGLTDLDRSTAIPGLNREQLYDIHVPIPGQEEQDRIVAILKELEAKKSAAFVRLKAAATSIRRFRQSVLAAACSGCLTADWRESHPDLSRAGTSAARNSSVDGLVETPEEWSWCTLAEIAEVKGGIQKGAKFPSNTTRREVPYLRVANVQRGWLDLSEIKTIPVPENRIAELRLQVGDILFNEGGDRDKLGRGWVWEGQIEECIHQNHVFRARLRDRLMQPKFFSWFGNSVGAAYFIDQGKQTVNLASLNMKALKALPVPMPSPEEQAEIVRRTGELLRRADAISSAIDHALSHVFLTSDAVLSTAFRGGFLEVTE